MSNDVRIARVFAAGSGEPTLGDARQSWLADSAERERIAEYLRAGVPILMTTALQIDRLDPDRGKTAGASYPHGWHLGLERTGRLRLSTLPGADTPVARAVVIGCGCPQPQPMTACQRYATSSSKCGCNATKSGHRFG